MDERLPWLGVQFYAWFSDSTKSRPNDSQSCRFHGSQLKGSEHRSPSASVWMEIGGREQKTISKCLGSKTVWFQILSCGFGGQGRWSCCVSMSCFVFRIWYLMGNYRGRMVISYLSCCAFLSWLAPRNRSWRTGDVGWLSLSASFSPTAGMWMWQALVNWHAPNNSLPPNAEISFWTCRSFRIFVRIELTVQSSLLASFCLLFSLFLADGLTVCSNIFFSKDSSSRIDWPWLASAGRV